MPEKGLRRGVEKSAGIKAGEDGLIEFCRREFGFNFSESERKKLENADSTSERLIDFGVEKEVLRASDNDLFFGLVVDDLEKIGEEPGSFLSLVKDKLIGLEKVERVIFGSGEGRGGFEIVVSELREKVLKESGFAALSGTSEEDGGKKLKGLLELGRDLAFDISHGLMIAF